MITSSGNQSTYHQGPSSPLFSSSDSTSSPYIHHHHPSTATTPIVYHYNYYNSPISTHSPISSPHILNHHYQPITSYYPQSSTPTILMDPYSSPHLQQSPSPPISCLSSMSNHHHSTTTTTTTTATTASSIRYDISLEAPTAASQKIDESPLTYLNKGQYYNISLRDNEKYNGDIISVISINFHDESHRLGATDYWKFWLTQQKDVDTARAVEIDLTRSNGAQVIECRQFDRVSFKWFGKLGASVHVRFNCLSTDFSRIKGVKGIPLRLQIESEQVDNHQQPTMMRQHPERTYCRIKLFRDKGAERKNKDDAKHIERQLEKLRGKHGEAHPLWLAFSPTAPITLFREIILPGEEENNLHKHNTTMMDDPRLVSHDMILPSNNNSSNILLPPPTAMKRPFSSSNSNNFQQSNSELNNTMNYIPSNVTSNALSIVPPPIGLDPNYVPQRRRRIAKLSLLVKFETCEVYRAIYLEHLTVKELTDKIVQRMNIQKPVSNVLRKITPKDNSKPVMIVEVNDEVIQDMNEEQDIHIETENTDDDAVNLILNF